MHKGGQVIPVLAGRGAESGLSALLLGTSIYLQ